MTKTLRVKRERRGYSQEWFTGTGKTEDDSNKTHE